MYPRFSRMLEAICVLRCGSSTQTEREPNPGSPDPPTQREWSILPSDRGRGLPKMRLLPSPGTPPRSRSPGKQQPDWGGRAAWLPRHAPQHLTVLRGDLGDFPGQRGYFSEFFSVERTLGFPFQGKHKVVFPSDSCTCSGPAGEHLQQEQVCRTGTGKAKPSLSRPCTGPAQKLMFSENRGHTNWVLFARFFFPSERGKTQRKYSGASSLKHDPKALHRSGSELYVEKRALADSTQRTTRQMVVCQ